MDIWLPAIASAHGADLDRVNSYVHWLMAVLFLGWSIYFVYALFRFSASRNPRANPEGTKSHGSTYVEIGVVIAEAILLVGFSVPLWAARVDDFPDPEKATVAHIVGQQFAWNIHYAGPDGKFGRTNPKMVDAQSNPMGLDRADPAAADDVTTVNQLHLPVGKPALIYVSSMDVIHSFALQEMRVKQDAVPGNIIPLWFEPTVTTDEMRKRKGQADWNYQISCAQLCGLGHYRMVGYVTIDTPEQFASWMDEQVKAAKGAGEGGDIWG
jgi:cytochrome c oxidase subunit II